MSEAELNPNDVLQAAIRQRNAALDQIILLEAQIAAMLREKAEPDKETDE